MREKNKFHVTQYTFCQNDKSYEVMKSNLPTEHKRMHKFQQQQVGEEKNKFHVTHHTFRQNDKNYEVIESNLPPEDKQVHKLTKVAK